MTADDLDEIWAIHNANGAKEREDKNLAKSRQVPPEELASTACWTIEQLLDLTRADAEKQFWRWSSDVEYNSDGDHRINLDPWRAIQRLAEMNQEIVDLVDMLSRSGQPYGSPGYQTAGASEVDFH